jgi:hypothetical protein
LNEHRGFQTKETLMYRTVGMAVIALAAIALPAETSLAFGPGSGAGALVAPMASIGPAGSHVASKPGGGTASGVPSRGGGTATPQVKKLSPKGGAACFRACMHGVSGAGWGNFCDYSCYGH